MNLMTMARRLAGGSLAVIALGIITMSQPSRLDAAPFGAVFALYSL